MNRTDSAKKNNALASETPTYFGLTRKVLVGFPKACAGGDIR
jgi:hypothetical protein